jgi:hypothetical protein
MEEERNSRKYKNLRIFQSSEQLRSSYLVDFSDLAKI